MSRCKSWIAVVGILIIAAALAAVAFPHKAEAASLKGKLRSARLALRQSKDRLKAAEADLAAAVSLADTGLGSGIVTADPAAVDSAAVDLDTPAPSPSPSASSLPTLEELKARVARARHVVRTWNRRVSKLVRAYALQLRLAEWEQSGTWMPIIKIAAARYHVSADGIYRMMMRESGGQRFAGASSGFKGLFQYCSGTWSASWNPWRDDSIYDGSSQIFATAYAIHKGMGPQMWTTTFASLY